VRGLLAAAAVLLLAVGLPAQTRVTHVRTQIGVEAERLDLALADVDGDGRLDLLLPRYDRELGLRLLDIHLLRPNGAYPQEPDLRHELKSGIVGWGVGEFDPETPGRELLFLARDAAYVFDPRDEGYAGNLRRLVRAPMLLDVSGLRALPRWEAIADVDGDGVDEVALATADGLLLVSGTGRVMGGASLRPVPGQAPAGERRFKLMAFELTAQTLAGLLVPDEDHAALDPPPILFAEESQPLPFLADADGDGLRDLAWFAGGALHVLRARRDSSGAVSLEPEPGLSLRLEKEGGEEAYDLESVQLVEAGGGPAADLLVVRSQGSNPLSEEWQILLYHDAFAEGAALGQPAGIAVLESSRADPWILDVDGDGRRDLAVTSWSTDLVQLGLQGVRIRHSVFLYPATEEGRFRRRPRILSERSFDVEEFEAFALIPPLEADLSGDGRVDLLESDAKGTVEVRPLVGRGSEIRFGDPSLRVELDAAEAFLQVQDLNGDGIGDFVVTHLLSDVVETWVSLP